MLSVRTSFSALSCGLCLALASLAPAVVAAAPIDFNRDIRPILSNHCYLCHGPDAATREAGLRLDTPEGVVARLDSGGVAVVPGKKEESDLVRRIHSADPEERMPPPDSGKTLSPAQIELLTRWVADGAKTERHWSFVAPTRPELPPTKHADQAANAIDRFILAKLETLGLEPAPEANRETLIRRVTFDLTGLPPTLAEIDAFLADRSPDAYAKLVDRLFASPRYGEHMARYWLDAARYGDTHGLHLDNERSLWLYRDWVIEAFQRNQPFDQFTIEQLAGDLLPQPTLAQKIATGFQRCNVTTSEGGSIDDEVRVRYGIDRVETTGTVFLGLTVGCAACHDHKYDPITQRDFYQLYAFYNALAEQAMDGNAVTPPPIMQAPTPAQIARQAEIEAQIAARQQEIEQALKNIEYVDPLADQELPPLEPREFVWLDDELPPGAKPEGDWQWVSADDGVVHSGAKSTRGVAQGLNQHFFETANPPLAIGADDVFFAYVYLDPDNPPREVMLQWNDGSWEHRAIWGEDKIAWGTPDSPSRLPMGVLPETGKWVRLEVPAAKVGLPAGSRVKGFAATQFDGKMYWDKIGVVTRTPQAGMGFDSQRAWEAYERSQPKSPYPAPIQAAIKVDADKRTAEQRAMLRSYFLEHIYPQTRAIFAPLFAAQAQAQADLQTLEQSIATTMVMFDLEQPRESFILIRGAYDKPGDKVKADTPSVLPPLPEGAPRNRLGLAKWLVDPSHPLTARVTVNRFWQQHFGQGIVTTPNDFGRQGAFPTHPELLDWLATEFVQSGWNVQHIQRLIVTSRTYRQSSEISAAARERDPSNTWLARGPRFRFDAEVIRDSALAVSGLLVEQIGGKSVRPYQPDGVWEAVAFLSSNTREYKADAGNDLYRRSLYTFWKRTAPPASLATFDAPSRETCTVQRSRTNTPLQALVLLNDVQYVEAARFFAERILREGGRARDPRLEYAFRTAIGRRPNERELALLQAAFDKLLAEYRAKPEAAAKLLAVGARPRDEAFDVVQHAAWTMLASLLLNLDEAIMLK